MESGELVAQLTRLGLTSYEAKAYLALIRRDSFTAAQVARQSGLPRQRIYDVLASLVQKGLASARPGTVVKYAATAPELAIDLLLTAHRDDLARMERDARTMVSDLKPAFEAGQTHTDPLEYIEVLRDRRAINERFAELQAAVKQDRRDDRHVRDGGSRRRQLGFDDRCGRASLARRCAKEGVRGVLGGRAVI